MFTTFVCLENEMPLSNRMSNPSHSISTYLRLPEQLFSLKLNISELLVMSQFGQLPLLLGRLQFILQRLDLRSEILVADVRLDGLGLPEALPQWFALSRYRGSSY